MSNKLKEFRLDDYEERSLLIGALGCFRIHHPDSYYINNGAFDKLMQRLSQTECQPGGCSYCNEERAREESEQREDDE